jgi:uncharacterized protein YbjT (DUF2867 family)
MTNTDTTDESTILVLGGTGKTGSRLTKLLRARGAGVRTASRHGADVTFDWDDPATHGPALDGATAVYLVPPTQRLDYGDLVVAFLDRAEAAGVGHVTQLSARGVDGAPPEVTPRALELDLASRSGLTHSILRPGWFLQNFDDPGLFLPTGGRIAAPTGDGAEAFVHADDIAEAAAATLLAPADHDGGGYTLTGPEALSFAEVAERIAKASGRPVTHDDVDRETWVARAVAAGVPEDYAGLLSTLLDDRLRNGQGTATTDAVERLTGHPARGFDAYAAEPAVVAAWLQAP